MTRADAATRPIASSTVRKRQESTKGAVRTATVSVASMVESIVGCKWSVLILRAIAEGTVRPSAIQRACPRLSAKVMNERLRKLTRFDIAERHVRGEKPPIEVEYRLTPFGRRFLRILDEVRKLEQSVERDRSH